MVRPLMFAARLVLVPLSALALSGCGAIAPGAALHADADAETASVDDELAAAATPDSGQPVTSRRLSSDVLGDAYYGPGQVMLASADEPDTAGPTAAQAAYTEENVADEQAAATAQAGTVEAIDAAAFDSVVLKADGPVLVDFSASWCGPCKRLAPILDQLAADRPDVKVVTIDVDQNPQLATSYRVRSVPTLILFRQGEVAAQHKGTASLGQLNQLLAR